MGEVLPPLPKQRGKSAPQYLEKGLILNQRFRLVSSYPCIQDSLIGGGGFGQIFRSVNEDTQEEVAVKVEPICVEAGRMVLEQRVLALLLSSPFTPTLYASGSVKNYNYIIMEKLGRNVTDLRKKQKSRRLSLPFVCRVATHVTNALQLLHNIGFLHRDIKPSNMCIGLKDKSHTIVLIDFGMTRMFRNEKGEVRTPRSYAAFRGTMRYVSLNVHRRREQGTGDDLVALFYTLVELIEGQLPWRMITKPEAIVKEKETIPFQQFARRCPLNFKKMYEHAMSLDSSDIPNYNLVLSIFNIFSEAEIKMDEEMDKAREEADESSQ